MSIFVISNKGRKEIPAADCWVPNPKATPPTKTPCTTDQFQKLATDWDGEDLVKLFSILSGMEYKTLSNTHDIILEEQLLAATKFVYNEPQDFKESPMPYWVEVGGKKIRIPNKIGSLSIGQNIHIRKAMDKCIEDKVGYERLISFVTAIFLQPFHELTQEELDKEPGFEGLEFNYHNAMQLEQVVLKMPITVTYPIAVFFLKKLNGNGGSILNRLNFLITRLLHLSNQRELQ